MHPNIRKKFRTLDNNTKASQQAPISEILQAYRNRTLGSDTIYRDTQTQVINIDNKNKLEEETDKKSSEIVESIYSNPFIIQKSNISVDKLGVVQMQKTEQELWDGYFEAYDNRMNTKGRNDLEWRNWLQLFFNLETALFGVRKHEVAWGSYDSERVQSCYDSLAHLGFSPPPMAPDDNLIKANEILKLANLRFRAFCTIKDINRGAWAKSDKHGQKPDDYVQTSSQVIEVIRTKNLGNWWLMASDSSPARFALHRGAIDERGDFISHL